MNIWKHKEWDKFPGTWFIASKSLTDEQIISKIASNPKQYGNLTDWTKGQA